MGEVGLSGELRPVPQLERRLEEAARLGFKKAIVPGRANGARTETGIEVVRADSLREAMRVGIRGKQRGESGQE
ncbi:MAG: DNA repair protein RadA, partial [Dehalococcoidia bacterium]|nr:DNA repair protein RadA [Dehalococcoidia bacterium]